MEMVCLTDDDTRVVAPAMVRGCHAAKTGHHPSPLTTVRHSSDNPALLNAVGESILRFRATLLGSDNHRPVEIGTASAQGGICHSGMVFIASILHLILFRREKHSVLRCYEMPNLIKLHNTLFIGCCGDGVGS